MKVIARNSNLLVKITVLVMVSLCINTALALDGSGTEQDPWRIKSLEDFNEFAADANYWAGFTRLETDVNLAGMVYERAVIAPDVNDEEFWFQGTAFTGVFDGNDHKISNLTCDSNDRDYIGLFGEIQEPNGEIKNLGLINPNVDARKGALVGSLVGSVGHFRGRSITHCYAEGGRVWGGGFVGGLAGNTGFEVMVTDCYATCSVLGNEAVGGLVGWNRSNIYKCYSAGSVTGTTNVGGLVGWNMAGFVGAASIWNSYSAGSVSGTHNVGGLVGYNLELARIVYCYSSGSVSGTTNVGGLVGLNDNWAPDSFWDIETSGQDLSDGGTGLPTADMQIESTFTDAGWDFINVWNIGENQTYPYLRTYLPSDINKDGIVNFLDLSITANQWMEEQ